MKTTDVKRSVEAALEKTDITPNNRPRLLSDNGSCYISNELGVYLDEKCSQTRKLLQPERT